MTWMLLVEMTGNFKHGFHMECVSIIAALLRHEFQTSPEGQSSHETGFCIIIKSSLYINTHQKRSVD